MKIKNNYGDLVEFDVSKLENSLRNAGASEEEIIRISAIITPNCFEGITTKQLYKMAFDELRSLSNSVAARYSLKKALLDLGPAGFYFERWISRVFVSLGYQTENSQHIKGHAVTHEADVIAHKGDMTFWIECKFRNSDESKISVTTPMYVLSRIKDICDIDHKLFGKTVRFTDGWLVTNSYFTRDSIDFGEFYNLRMLSWDYPKDKSIRNLVDANVLYPITCLTTINEDQKKLLLEKDCILVKELKGNSKYINKLSLNDLEVSNLNKEIKELLETKISE